MSFWVYPKGVWPVDRTWLSNPGPIPDDLPAEFTEEDLAEQTEIDEAYAARVAEWKTRLKEMIG